MENRYISNVENQEIDLLELLYVLKTKILWIVLSALIVGFLSFVYTTRFITPKYQASIRMIVNSKRDAYTSLTISDVTSAEQLVETYSSVIKSNRVMDRVIEELDLNMSWTTLDSMVSIRAVNNTPVMNIIATTSDPEFSRKIVTTISEVAPEIVVDAVEAGSCKVITDAYSSGVPVSPNIRKNTFMGVAAGALLTSGIFVLLHLLNNSVQSEEELAEYSKTTVLSTIPKIPNKDSKGKKMGNAVVLNDNSPFEYREAYVRLRTNLIYTTLNGEHKTIIFTSCNESDGKSTTVLSLASSLAKSGKKVIVIDCDLRKSKMEVYTNHFEREKCLGSILSNVIEMSDEAIYKNEAGYDVIYAGRSVPNPSELLGSEKMKLLVDNLKEKYDFILLDCPPILSVSDAAILSNVADGALIVVKHKSTLKKELNTAFNSLKEVGINIIGTILTQYNHKKDYKNYNYGHYYYRNYYGDKK